MFIIRNIRGNEFKDLIKQNDESIRNRLVRIKTNSNETDKSVLEHTEYKMLELQYIKKLWVQLRDKEMLISINTSAISGLKKIDFSLFLQNVIEKREKFNKILIGNKLEILDEENFKYDLRFKAQEVSRINKIAFYLNSSGVTVYFEGKKVKTSIFYEDKDFIDYSNRRPITELKEVLDEYKKEHLLKVKDKFFENEEVIQKYRLNCQTLSSEIDKLLKDDLVEYLTKNLQYTFTKNGPLQGTGHNVDIYTIADNKLYFIMIEWLGYNIDSCKTKLVEVHDEDYVERAIEKTLEYIRAICNNKLQESENGVEKAYLTLFDAREDNGEIKYEKYINSLRSEHSDSIKKFEIIDKYNINRNDVA